MSKVFKSKLFVNKNNKQITIVLSRKKLKMFKDKVPKELKLKIEGVKW